MIKDIPEIKLILFDADGVLQLTSPSFMQVLRGLCPESQSNQAMRDEFTTAVFAAEVPCLTGKARFEDELQPVLSRFGSTASLTEARNVWHLIKPIECVFDVIRELRKAHRIGLATNQQHHRAAFMRDTLAYTTLFDDLFISCEMGSAKPDSEYFAFILASVLNDGIRANEIVFIDDREDNVDAACRNGINGVQYEYTEGSERLKLILQSFHLTA